MAIQDNSTLWNKLGSAAQVTASELGPNGIITGALAYAPCRFDDGVARVVGTGVEYPGAHPVNIPMIFEYWWKPGYSNVTVVDHYPYDAYNGANDFVIVNHRAGKPTEIIIRQAGVPKLDYRYGFAYAAGSVNHILVVIDSTSGATQRARLWFNGVFQVPALYSVDLAFVFGGGVMDVSVGGFRTRTVVENQVVDNVKIYDSDVDLVEILANRNNEGWPVTGGKRMIDGGLRNMVDASPLIS